MEATEIKKQRLAKTLKSFFVAHQEEGVSLFNNRMPPKQAKVMDSIIKQAAALSANKPDDNLEAYVERLREALRPFAALAEHYPAVKKYGNRPTSGILFEISSGDKTAGYTVEDLHAAAEVFKEAPPLQATQMKKSGPARPKVR